MAGSRSVVDPVQLVPGELSESAKSKAAESESDIAEKGFGSPAYQRYALWLLMIIYVINFVDRTIIYMLIEPIKKELQLLDWQLGLLSGLAFGLVYMALSFPLAALADKYNRPVIIGICLAVWSFFTAVCGLAANFIQLVLARAGVGVGEAGCVPAAHALIADSTAKSRRASALALFAIGAPLGQLIGSILAGYVSDLYGWRAAFYVAAAPGLLLTILCFMTLREPRNFIPVVAKNKSIPFAETLRYLRNKPGYWQLGVAASIRTLVSYGHGPFLASFFYRVHGDEVAQLGASLGMQSQTFVGFVLALITGVTGMGGIWVGGWITDRFGATNMRIYGSVPAWSTVVIVPIAIWAFLTDSLIFAIALTAISYFLQALWAAPVYAAAQGVVPPRMRAKSSALMIFMINFGGLLVGALLVGAISDLLSTWAGMDTASSLRWSLVATMALSLISAPFFWRAGSTIHREIES
jgi:MFS family permease